MQTTETTPAGGFTYPNVHQTPSVEGSSFTEDGEEFSAENLDRIAQEAAEESKDPALMTYAERLERNEIKKEEALIIIDALLSQGKYSETVKLGPERTAKLVTRSTRFNTFLSDTIDIADPQKVGKLNQLMTEYQMAASLVEFCGRELPDLSVGMPEDVWRKTLEEKVRFVRTLPSPVFIALCNKLSRFDAKIILVFSEGYDENF